MLWVKFLRFFHIYLIIFSLNLWLNFYFFHSWDFMTKLFWKVLFGEYSLQNSISNKIHIQGKTISSRVLQGWVSVNHSIFSSHWIGYSTSENFRKHISIIKLNSALLVYIKLGVWNFLAKLKTLLICIKYWNRTGLIAACPYKKITVIQTLSLLFMI